MKRLSLLTLAAVFSLGISYAQNEMDAYKFSSNDLTGTARSVAMGGAFGALGGDISGVAINPAGIGVYKKSEIVTTLNFQNTKMQTELNAGKVDESKFKFAFDNLAFVGVFPLHNDDVPFINVGFSYNRLKTFDRKYRMIGDNTASLTDYMADRATLNRTSASDLSLKVDNPWGVWDTQDWLSVLGYNAGLIVPLGTSDDEFISSTRFKDDNNSGLPAFNELYSEESGYMNSYDFNIGTSIADVVSIGATISMTDINYNLSSTYTEEALDVDNNKNYWGVYNLHNWVQTDGTGWQVKAGLIVKPIQELRIGVSYHSPTWYKMTDHFAADLVHNLNDLKPNTNLLIPSDYQNGVIRSYDSNDGPEDAVIDYKLRTPDKWTISMAGVIASKAIISADYELTNYKNNMKLFDRNNNDIGPSNSFIKNDFKMASAIRVGLEYRFTNKFSGRVGYSWVESPFQKSLINNPDSEVTTDFRPVTQYAFGADTHYFTYGLGYQFIPERGGRNSDRSDMGYFYTDVAFVMKSQKSDLYAFTGADKVSMKNNSVQGLLTIGYKFSMDY